MKVEISPGRVSGSILPPASKSILHRSIISACLAKGTSRINNVVYNEDVLATINAFKTLGVDIQQFDNHLVICSNGLNVIDSDLIIDCNESGSTIRFLIPLLSNENKVYFKGKTGLINRPMSIYETIFNDQGLLFERTNEAIVTKGRLSPGNYSIPGNISSQFISGLLFVLPLLDGDSNIEISGNFESSDYVDITVNILKLFGINIQNTTKGFFVAGNQSYQPTTLEAETDFSQLAFFAALGSINNDIEIQGVNFDSLQPDRRILDVLQSIGGIYSKEKNILTVRHAKTHGEIIDVSQCPDLGPILGLLLAYSDGESKIANAKRLVIKESNRLLSTHETLKKFGVVTEMGEDYLKIYHSNHFNGGTFDSYNDHRIAMMISIAATIANSKVIIERAEAVNKSYPNFYKDLESLGVNIKYI